MRYLQEQIYKKLLGPLDAHPTVWAMYLFADPIAVIAVLRLLVGRLAPIATVEFYLRKRRKYPAMVLLLEKLIKIDIHRLVQNDYWAATVGDYRLELNPIRSGANYFLTLNVNDVPTPRRWMLSNRPIRGRLQRGGRIPWDKSEVWYVHSANGRRRSHLYIDAATCLIGTRDEHGARYRGNCLSAKKREAEKLFRKALHAIRRNKS